MRYLDKLEEGAAKKEKLSPKQYRNLMTAVSRVKSVEREASGSEPSDAFSRGVKKGAKGEILRQHERKKKKALGEAKKRFYTKDEVDAYARGREKATIERRKKEFEDFKDGVIRKSKEDKPKKKLKAEAYIQLGDVLAEAITEDKAEENFRKREAMQKMVANMNAKSAAADAKIPKPAPKPGVRTRVADKLDKFSREQYRKGEVDDASGKERRAGLRGKVAHFVGKASQKVRPKNEG